MIGQVNCVILRQLSASLRGRQSEVPEWVKIYTKTGNFQNESTTALSLEGGIELKPVWDDYRKHGWRLADRGRPYQPFKTADLIELELDRDEYSRQANQVYQNEDAKFKRRLDCASRALDALKEHAPELIAAPRIPKLSFSGPLYSLPLSQYFEKQAPVGKVRIENRSIDNL